MAKATAPRGATGQLATWLSRLSLQEIPDQVKTRAKHLLLDGLGCALIGAQLPWSRTAVEAVTRFEGSGPATLAGWGRTTSVPAAAVLNSTFIQGFELDDVHPLAPLHSASLIIPAILAAADLKGDVPGEALLRAAIAGFEVGPRIGLALHGSEMISRGWHSGVVFGTLASAAATGTVLQLDAAGFEDAFGIAATQSGGLMAAQFGAMSKRMQHGFASRNGLYGAYLASGGYSGIKQVIEQPYGGLLSTFGEGHSPDVSQVTSELGRRWETNRIVVKQFAAMAGLHAGLEALFEISTQRPLRANDIAKIEVELSHAVFHHGWWKLERPLTPTAAQMNVAYALAVGVLDGEALLHQFSPARINRDDVWALIPRIEARHNPAFDEAGPQGRGRTKLTIRFNDGSVIEREKLAASSATTPIADALVVKKFRALTSEVISEARQRRLEEIVLSLEELSSVDALTEVLAPTVNSPFEPPGLPPVAAQGEGRSS